jgi:hypothetical protein
VILTHLARPFTAAVVGCFLGDSKLTQLLILLFDWCDLLSDASLWFLSTLPLPPQAWQAYTNTALCISVSELWNWKQFSILNGDASM